MSKQMCWMGTLGGSEEKVLHLEVSKGNWQPYHLTSYAVPDYNVPRGSKGWATFQSLLKSGWEVVGAPR